MIQSMKNNGLRVFMLPRRGLSIRAIAPEITVSTNFTTRGL